MNLGGWIFMLGSWAVILGLFVYCIIRTLGSGKRSSAEKRKK
jgi:hypothetical protein